ncbi:MAG: Holliday junction resolvase RuvX [Rhodobacteraceae bacterium]|nr:Holliday junction resolvase RuvX [Paracoccaceae bacterium]
MGTPDFVLWHFGRSRKRENHLDRGPSRLWQRSGRDGATARRRKKRRGDRVITDDITEFAKALPPLSPLIGLDLGTKTIGIAVSDTFLSVATPLETIKRKKFSIDAEAVIAIINTRGIAGMVLGLPRNMDGSEGPRCQATRAFARNFERLHDMPIAFWDERLSTVAAEKALLEADTTRKRRSEVIDHVAASYILQGTLDRIQHINRADT